MTFFFHFHGKKSTWNCFWSSKKSQYYVRFRYLGSVASYRDVYHTTSKHLIYATRGLKCLIGTNNAQTSRVKANLNIEMNFSFCYPFSTHLHIDHATSMVSIEKKCASVVLIIAPWHGNIIINDVFSFIFTEKCQIIH